MHEVFPHTRNSEFSSSHTTALCFWLSICNNYNKRAPRRTFYPFMATFNITKQIVPSSYFLSGREKRENLLKLETPYLNL